ncbi:STAS domain-containing protein [Streptomyces sp. NPDC006879]|uniref:STAS domain-containing protein n=1 Tax=Streptomyces sp. NPDC006879 TaxID=3364767 RepID=UPI0036995B79
MQPDGYGRQTTGGERFTAHVSRAVRSAVIALSGELDHDSADRLRAALDEALALGTERVLVDCAGLGFCDSTGLNVLLQGRLAAQEADSRLELAALRPAVSRMLDLTGAKAVFTVHAGLDEAFAETGRP